MIHVHVDGVQRRQAAFNVIVAPANRRANALQHIGEANIALYAVAADTGHAHGAAADRRRRQKIRRAGGISFHQILSRRPVYTAAGEVKHLIIIVPHFNTEAFH